MRKKIIASFILFSFLFLFSPSSAFAISNTKSVFVKGYCKKNGKCVKGYWRTIKNSKQKDNYACKGNYNPHTKKYGKKNCK